MEEKKTYYKIISQFSVGDFTVLEIDRPITDRHYYYYRIDGIDYRGEIVYDLPNHIGIKATGDFVGKTFCCV